MISNALVRAILSNQLEALNDPYFVFPCEVGYYGPVECSDAVRVKAKLDVKSQTVTGVGVALAPNQRLGVANGIHGPLLFINEESPSKVISADQAVTMSIALSPE